ncbi:DUF4367 domain-containing protein [uncultured Robinsoniella sp.]|uniref:DUF4367 domain-containing protein n=1 Tax=uncultured Robinsoniella sp. TaxID=904190 RepID=UPI00374E7DED
MEGKLRKNSDKIEPFPKFSENTESVDDMDEALRQQLIKAADEYEKILNSDSSLDYIDEMEESPELFEAVIQKLKDEKKWVDEEETNSVRKEDVTENTMGDEKKENIKSDENREKVYEMLSDEDRKALAIGRRKLKQHKRTKVLKASGIAAMVCLCLFGVSMTSSASRDYIFSLLNSLSGNGLHVQVENVGNDHIDSKISEDEAIKNIEKQLEIKMAKFSYKPEGMEFLSVSFDETTQDVILQYTYNDTIVNVYMYKMLEESSRGQVFDGQIRDDFIVEFDKDDVMVVTELENPNNEISYAAQFSRDKCYYSITAIMPKEEVVKMLKNIYF